MASSLHGGSDAVEKRYSDGATSATVVELSSEAEKEHFQVPDDCYGDMIMTIVVAVGNSGCNRCSFGRRLFWSLTSFAIFLLNVFLQLGLSFILFATAVQHSEEKYKDDLGDRVNMLRQSINVSLPLDHTMFGDMGPSTMEMCAGELASIRGFYIVYFMVVFLWYTRMTQELAESIWICAVVWAVEPMPEGWFNDDIERPSMSMLVGARSGLLRSLSLQAVNGDEKATEAPTLLTSSTPRTPRSKVSEMAPCLPHQLTKQLEEECDQNQVVVRLTPTLRFLLLILVGFWKIMLALWITWVGAKFLVMSSSTSCLIIKSLSLQFLIQIDEMLFRAFASVRRMEEIRRSKLKYRLPESAWWAVWGSSLVRFLFVFLMSALTLWCIFGTISEFRSSCFHYFQKFGAPQHVSSELIAGWSFF